MKSAKRITEKNEIVNLSIVKKYNDEQGKALTLKECVRDSLEQYFSHLGDEHVNDIYQMVINEVEPSLFQAVLKHTRGNQSRAAEILGLNRGTLRKKLKHYDID